MQTNRVRVLVVDDSPVVRSLLSRALSQHPAIEVVGIARDGLETLRQIELLCPDVVTLDVEMPRLSGLEVLERVGGKVPASFLMCSALTRAGARTTLEALNKGAFDFVLKPERGGLVGEPQFRSRLHEKVIAAARAKGRTRRIRDDSTARSPSVPRLPPDLARRWVVGVGISCGGPQTLSEMLPAFPADFVPIVVTQHMPAPFTTLLAEHLDHLCEMQVREAGDGMPLRPGTVLIAPGAHHLQVVRRGAELSVKLDGGPKVSGHRPSVDVMFTSLARGVGSRCVGIIMTGMGHDGVEGIRALRQAGARTLAQDEQTSLVYGMPKAAVATGCIERSVPSAIIPRAVANIIQGARSDRPSRLSADIAGAEGLGSSRQHRRPSSGS